MRHLCGVVVFAASLAVAGCSPPAGVKPPADPTSTTGEKPTSTSETEAASVAEADSKKAAVTTSGRWLLIMTQGGTDFLISLVEIVPDRQSAASEKGQFEVRHLEETGVLPKLMLETAEAAAETVHLVYDSEGDKLDFRGTLAEGAIRGNMVIGRSIWFPARLMPTTKENLDGERQARGTAALNDFQEILQDKGGIRQLAEFAAAHAESPIAIDVYERAIASAARESLDDDGLKKLVEGYLSAAANWGERAVEGSRVEVAYLLSMNRYASAATLRYVEQAEENLKDEELSQFGGRLEGARVKAEVQQALELIVSDDPQTRERSADRLRQHYNQIPFDPVVNVALAEFDEREGRLDEAMAGYAELAVLPLMQEILKVEWDDEKVEKPLPSETVERLWKEKHGNSDGLAAYLDQVYHERIDSFADERVPPRGEDEGNRVVLCELFTGAFCPPCLPADVALMGIEKTFPTSQVIAVRYHQHIPAPDPLANQDGESRLHEYYKVEGTPAILINGVDMLRVSGVTLADAIDTYRSARTKLEPLLSQRTSLQIDASALAEQGTLNISASVGGFEGAGDNLRLRLLIVEDEVDLATPNGIRSHEMTVRRMVGGPEGIAPKDGAIEFSTALKLADLKQRLVDYLTEFEIGQEIEFQAKPLELKHLHLVAFVQDDETKEVLQAVALPVTGTIEYPEIKPGKARQQ